MNYELRIVFKMSLFNDPSFCERDFLFGIGFEDADG